MRIALVDPPWTFEGSIYFGCREPHLPLELGYAQALLEADGHDARIFDAHMAGCGAESLRSHVAAFRPDAIVVTTAPSYLFWRCAPPELRVPQETVRALDGLAESVVAVGPHGSTTPRTALRKLGADVVVIGECEEVLVRWARTPRARWGELASIAWRDGDQIRVQGPSAAADFSSLPALSWSRSLLSRHRHHHHRFDREPDAPGAEVEASRGCPYHCTFCAKDEFRDDYRKRPVARVLEEIDGLVANGVRYVYFVDEIFLPDKALLGALCERDLVFGVQMRVDHWNRDMLDLLGRAGCVSIEAGIESLTPEGRSLLDKKCKLSTQELTDRLVYAKQRVPFVQANLLSTPHDRADDVRSWRAHLRDEGVWANDPVPLFPYPGSPEYTRRWGKLDDDAWERAVDAYLAEFARFSDIQEERPRALRELELPMPVHG